MDMSVYRQAKLAQNKSNNHLFELLETLHQMAWSANPTGKIIYFNQVWYTYTGMRAGQTEGWINFIHPEDSPLVLAAWNQALISGHYHVEYRVRNHKDGSYKWFLEQAEPISDDNKKIILWVGTFTDIADQKQHQEP